MNADSSDPANTWQEIFKSFSIQHHGFVDSIGKAMMLLKIGAGNDNKIVFLKSDIMLRSRGMTFFLQPKSHQGPVSLKSEKLYGPEKPVVKLQSPCFE